MTTSQGNGYGTQSIVSCLNFSQPELGSHFLFGPGPIRGLAFGVNQFDRAVCQCDRAVSQLDRAVSQLDRAVSLGQIWERFLR